MDENFKFKNLKPKKKYKIILLLTISFISLYF